MTELLDGCGVAVRWVRFRPSVSDGVVEAILGETGLGGAREFLAGGGAVAGRVCVLLTLRHEAGERGPGEPLCACLAFAGVRHGGASRKARQQDRNSKRL